MKEQIDLCRCCLLLLSCQVVYDSFVTPWSPLGSSVHGFPRQKYWSWKVPFPSPGHILDSGIKWVSPILAGRFITAELPGKTRYCLDIGFI